MNPLDALRADVLHYSREMALQGLVVASAGNVTARLGDTVAVTPTSIPYAEITVDQICLVSLADGSLLDGSHPPSGELPMHLEIYRQLPELAAIVHTHSPFVTILSALRRPLPPMIDEMMIYFGGEIQVADYAFTGTVELGRNVVRALGDRTGAILSNHGNVCVGATLRDALHVAIVMESAARTYVGALAVGEPARLDADAIAKGRRMYEERRGRWAIQC